ncbi:MAG: OmpA family protein [Chitinophagales bacterium]
MITRKTLIIALLLASTASFAQIESVVKDEWIPESRMEQHNEFKAGDYAYPAKPRSKWNIGLSLGVPFVTGDVAADPFGGHDGPPMGVGLNIRKGWGYLVSVRAHANYGVTYGQNYTPVTYEKNDRINGNFANDSSAASTGVDYLTTGTQYIPNFKNTTISGGIDFIFNLNNVNFHKAESRFLPYLFAGIGAMSYNVKVNALDADGNIYDYNTLIIDYRDVADREPKLDDLMDDTYETQADVDGSEKGDDVKTLRFSGDFGAGLLWRLGEKGNFELGVEHRLSWTGDDLLDGQQWELGGTQTSAIDFYHFSALTVGVNIGKNAQQPLWEVNPMGFIYSKLNEFDIANLLADADDDGVVDYLDREPNTPAGTPVDTHGVSLDSDKDGCPDSEDPEPFSTPNMPIENCQNVFVTENRVNEIIDERLKGIDLASLGGGAGSNWYLPMIFFDLDKSNIRPDAVASLASVADIMKQYPKLKVEVVGYADTRASENYNLKLSENRAKAAIEYLSSKGIDQSRFTMKYEGESNNLIPNATRESEHQMNRRVEFHIVK